MEKPKNILRPTPRVLLITLCQGQHLHTGIWLARICSDAIKLRGYMFDTKAAVTTRKHESYSSTTKSKLFFGNTPSITCHAPFPLAFYTLRKNYKSNKVTLLSDQVEFGVWGEMCTSDPAVLSVLRTRTTLYSISYIVH